MLHLGHLSEYIKKSKNPGLSGALLKMDKRQVHDDVIKLYC